MRPKTPASLSRLFYAYLCVLLLNPCFAATTLYAQDFFKVDSTVDAIDNNLGDNLCSTAAGDCTLRAAIMEANLSAADTIYLPAGTYTLSIVGTGEDVAATGDLDITQHLTIVGDGASSTIVDANKIDRVFDIPTHASRRCLTLSGVTVTNGKVTDGGGAIKVSSQCLTLADSTVSSSSATQNGGGLLIQNAGNASIFNSLIDSNEAGGSGGGVRCENGAVCSFIRSRITNNKAATGGGLQSSNGADSFLSEATVSDNTTTGEAGGVKAENGGDVTFVSSSVSKNSSDTTGGAGATSGGGEFYAFNSTFSNNSATTNGNEFYYNAGGGELRLFNSTVFNDISQSGASLSFETGTGGAFLSNSIVTGASTACEVAGTSSVTSFGNNIASDDSCALVQDGDQSSTDPALAILADNGGVVMTHFPKANSPAIDTANDDLCLLQDAIGVSRPVDGDNSGSARCDIGAVEYFVDCNMNDIIDSKDIADGNSQDCDSNSLPDECEQDTDNDGTIDACEPEIDCNSNNILDSTDISEGRSTDCDANSIPDECESDSDNDGTIDACAPTVTASALLAQLERELAFLKKKSSSRKLSKSIKTSLSDLNNLVTSGSDFIKKDSSSDIPALNKEVRRTVLKALKVRSKKFKKNRKKATRAIDAFQAAI